ncbi:MAG: SRPBCC family protein [Anaerolineales bacterium]|nr:SRPBCC family protein [Anaerolineales bacterium]
MARIDQTIIIHAPLEKIYKFLSSPLNLPEIWPAMVEVRNVNPNILGGMDFEWEYKMAGVKFEGASEVTELMPNKRIITRSKKGIESTFCWEFENIAEGTRVHLEVAYKIPLPLIGKLAETVVYKQNEHEAYTLLHNLKDRLEIQVPITI